MLKKISAKIAKKPAWPPDHPSFGWYSGPNAMNNEVFHRFLPYTKSTK